MIGGQVIIPIRNASNEKVYLLSTPTTLKAGTFNKILRAIDLQKELVIEDLYTTNFTLKYTAGSLISSVNTYDGKKRIIFEAHTVSTSSGNPITVYIYITEDDTAFFTTAS